MGFPSSDALAPDRCAEDSRREFRHLEGARGLACFWIVCAHYMPKRDPPLLNGAVFRVNVAVCFFVVTSGFVTQWVYGARRLDNAGALALFYLRRLGRVLLTFWVALALALGALAALGEDYGDTWYVVRCALFIEQWVKWCPNGPSWFVFVLLPSWLLYPLTRRLVEWAEGRGGISGLSCLVIAFYAVSFGPAVALFAAQRGNITMQQHADMSFWPPAQLADFAIGVAVAALARQSQIMETTEREALVFADSGSEGSGGETQSSDGGLQCAAARVLGVGPPGLSMAAVCADACLAIIVATVFFLPRPTETSALLLNGWEPLMDHGFALLIGGFLYGAAVSGTSSERGFAARLLGHRALEALGADSFEVYIFQRPVHDCFRLFFDTTATQVFVAYVLVLWLFAAAYARYVQAPVDGWIRGLASAHGPLADSSRT